MEEYTGSPRARLFATEETCRGCLEQLRWPGVASPAVSNEGVARTGALVALGGLRPPGLGHGGDHNMWGSPESSKYLILSFAYVESVCKCRAPNSPGGLNGRIASVIASPRARPTRGRWHGSGGERRDRSPVGGITTVALRPVLRPSQCCSRLEPVNQTSRGARISGPTHDRMSGGVSL